MVEPLGIEPSYSVLQTDASTMTARAPLWWVGEDSNFRCPKTADLQSAAIATMRPTHNDCI